MNDTPLHPPDSRSSLRPDRHPLLLPAAALLLGAAHQLLFYEQAPGLSVPLFVILFELYLWTFGRGAMRAPDRAGILLTLAVLLLSMTYALFANIAFYLLNLLALPALLAWQVTYLLGAKRRDWADLRLLPDAFGHLLRQTILHIPDLFRLFRRPGAGKGNEEERERSRAFKQIVYGLLLAAPILIIVGMLLVSADGVLRGMLDRLPDLLSRLSLEGGLGRSIWALVFAIFFFTYVSGFLTPRFAPPVQGPQPVMIEDPPLKLEPVVLATLLTVINLVYLLFVALQFSYLFGAWSGILPESASYAEYARSGFGELIGVTFINLGVLVLGLYGSTTGTGAIGRFNRALLYLLVFCSIGMLGSAFSRLALYEQAYGYTQLRFLVHAFMIFLFLLLLLFGVCVGMRRLSLAKWSVALAVCSYLAINYVCMDRMIAVLNLGRATAGAEMDLGYLNLLSDDAVPVLIQARNAGRDELDEMLRQRWATTAGDKSSWQSWTLSQFRAHRLLEEQYVND
ncbi:DUF4173 domain-containing protein [Saccharibacillus sp. CPCC 101409]|uniref:DUF4153 domain-containing protein n=1 Tax=Saccharibacillus sp. CPCC 101409 TaxID=3058041 RepID=UPI002672435F|nr:DUF4173 domain-containing protein [Saccharibacillus sp. CPCC 101409]MDO3409974.1 DUF4173 domain-containing protein [Saccharibacillus sp. CPCC 101409]